MVQLKTLYQIGLQSVLNWLNRTCLKLEENSCPSHETALRTIKNFVHKLPLLISEDLARAESQRCYIVHYILSKPNQPIQYLKKKWAILARPDLRRFDFEIEYHKSFWGDSNFWSSNLQGMSNLKELRLSIRVNDDILYAISQGCSKNLEILEFLTFERVTHQGFRCLEKCKRLKKVGTFYEFKLNDSYLEALASLLFVCPELQILGDFCMDKLLDYTFSKGSPLNPLKLIYVKVSTNINIKMVEELCPNLKRIRIDEIPSINPSVWGPTFDGLASCKLALEAVTFRGFACFDKFEHFLQKKGSEIKSISCCPSSEYHEQHVKVIGENCPHLKDLELDNLSLDLTDVIPKLPGQVWFNELTSVSLSGSPESISPLLLKLLLPSGNEVEKLKVSIDSRGSTSLSLHALNELMVKLLKSNRLKKITEICVPYLSINTLRRLIKELPCLMKVLLQTKLVIFYVFCIACMVKKTVQKEFKAFNITIDIT